MIGSSFISMELAVAVTKRNLASIDVIGMEEFPFEAVLGKQVGAALKKVTIHSSSLHSISQGPILIEINDMVYSSTNPKGSSSICNPKLQKSLRLFLIPQKPVR